MPPSKQADIQSVFQEKSADVHSKPSISTSPDPVPAVSSSDPDDHDAMSKLSALAVTGCSVHVYVCVFCFSKVTWRCDLAAWTSLGNTTTDRKPVCCKGDKSENGPHSNIITLKLSW